MILSVNTSIYNSRLSIHSSLAHSRVEGVATGVAVTGTGAGVVVTGTGAGVVVTGTGAGVVGAGVRGGEPAGEGDGDGIGTAGAFGKHCQ